MWLVLAGLSHTLQVWYSSAQASLPIMGITGLGGSNKYTLFTAFEITGGLGGDLLAF